MTSLRYWYAEDIADMLERVANRGPNPEGSQCESLAEIGADYGLSRLTVSNMLSRARKFGFAAYPKKPALEFGGYPAAPHKTVAENLGIG